MYLTYRKNDNFLVVIKEIAYERQETRNECLKKILTMMIQLKQHKNIMKIYEAQAYDYYDQSLCKMQFQMIIMMEYATKGNLQDFIEKHEKNCKIIPEKEIIRIMKDLTSGLQQSHLSGKSNLSINP